MIVSVCMRWSKTTRMSLSISARSGSPSDVRVRVAQRLDGAHEVVAEEPDRTARERRAVGQRRLRVALDLRLGDRVRVAAVAQRPAQHLARAHADERVAAHPLALLGGLQQERRGLRIPAAQLEERRDGRLGVGDERVTQRDEVVVARELARLLQARPDGRRGCVSGDGQAGPPRRPRDRGRDCAAGPSGGRGRRRPPRRRGRRSPRVRRARPPPPPP